ncbi:hypothetical protein EJ110_NYTH10517 [Nymphaea thermarum]|nr:hypothetical protein EJ110_NYTH10517 [Nymphaea thermarum]
MTTASSILNRLIPCRGGSLSPYFISGFSRCFSTSNQYVVKVGIPEFLSGVGKGVETHIPKIEAEIGDFQKLLVTRTLKLKKLGIPCKHLRGKGRISFGCCL